MRPQLVGLVEQGQVEESPVGLDRVGWKSVGLSWVEESSAGWVGLKDLHCDWAGGGEGSLSCWVELNWFKSVSSLFRVG